MCARKAVYASHMMCAPHRMMEGVVRWLRGLCILVCDVHRVVCDVHHVVCDVHHVVLHVMHIVSSYIVRCHKLALSQVCCMGESPEAAWVRTSGRQARCGYRPHLDKAAMLFTSLHFSRLACGSQVLIDMTDDKVHFQPHTPHTVGSNLHGESATVIQSL